MTSGAEARTSVAPLEAGLRKLVRIAGAIAGSPEGQMRAVMSEAIDEVDPVAVEEIILQSYLFAGFPRALNAARRMRSISIAVSRSMAPAGANMGAAAVGFIVTCIGVSSSMMATSDCVPGSLVPWSLRGVSRKRPGPKRLVR